MTDAGYNKAVYTRDAVVSQVAGVTLPLHSIPQSDMSALRDRVGSALTELGIGERHVLGRLVAELGNAIGGNHHIAYALKPLKIDGKQKLSLFTRTRVLTIVQA